MDATELLRGILEATVATTLALMFVLVVRKPLRSAFGAGVAYAAWIVVPVALVAVLPPAKSLAVEWPAAVVSLDQGSMRLPEFASHLQAGSAQWICGAWFVGMLLMATRFQWLQRAFRRALGQLSAGEDGLLQAETSVGLPAVYGVWRARIVVPADFYIRYSEEERKLMEAHERSHAENGDLQANALVAVLRSVFWFNPLLHAASRHFRHDQELACDERVVRRYPQSRRSYGEAMFKTQLAAGPLPLGCHWGYGHPLKERIAMLKNPTRSWSRVAAGSTLVLALSLGAGFTAWSAQPAQPGPILLAASGPGENQTKTEGLQASSVNAQTTVSKNAIAKAAITVDGVAGDRVMKNDPKTTTPAEVFNAASIGSTWKWKLKSSYGNAETVPDGC